jgi:hypothetical protein
MTGDIKTGSTISGATLTGGSLAVGSNSEFAVASDGGVTIGPNGSTKVRIQPSISSNFVFDDAAAVEFWDGSTVLGFLQGDNEDITLFGSVTTVTGVILGSDVNYVGVFQTQPADYGIVLSATKSGEDKIAFDAGEGVYVSRGKLNIPNLNNPTTDPSPTTNWLYAKSGQLWWNNIRLDTSGTTYTFSSPLSESSGTVSIDLSGYSTTSHNHSGVYATSSHNHSGVYATSGHNHSGTYLPLSGGTMTGVLNLGTGTKKIEGGSGGGLMIDSSGSAYLRANDEGNFGVTAWSGNHTTIYNATSARIVTASSYNVSYADLVPSVTGTYNLGYSTGAFKWNNGYFSNNVYTHDGGVHVSDVSQKTDVVDSILGLDFINAVRPVSYKWVETEDRAGVRTHHGFIAQEIEAVLGEDASAMALWCNVHQPALAAEELPEGHVMEAVEESYTQSLRYTELVPILTKALQEISTKLDAAEARIATLESA